MQSQPRIMSISSSAYTTSESPVTSPVASSCSIAAPVVRSVVATVASPSSVMSAAPTKVVSAPLAAPRNIYSQTPPHLVISSGATYPARTLPTSPSAKTVIHAGSARVLQSANVSNTRPGPTIQTPSSVYVTNSGMPRSLAPVIRSSVQTSGPIVYRAAGSDLASLPHVTSHCKQNVASNPGLAQGAYEADSESAVHNELEGPNHFTLAHNGPVTESYQIPINVRNTLTSTAQAKIIKVEAKGVGSLDGSDDVSEFQDMASHAVQIMQSRGYMQSFPVSGPYYFDLDPGEEKNIAIKLNKLIWQESKSQGGMGGNIRRDHPKYRKVHFKVTFRMGKDGSGEEFSLEGVNQV